MWMNAMKQKPEKPTVFTSFFDIISLRRYTTRLYYTLDVTIVDNIIISNAYYKLSGDRALLGYEIIRHKYKHIN